MGFPFFVQTKMPGMRLFSTLLRKSAQRVAHYIHAFLSELHEIHKNKLAFMQIDRKNNEMYNSIRVKRENKLR